MARSGDSAAEAPLPGLALGAAMAHSVETAAELWAVPRQLAVFAQAPLISLGSRACVKLAQEMVPGLPEMAPGLPEMELGLMAALRPAGLSVAAPRPLSRHATANSICPVEKSTLRRFLRGMPPYLYSASPRQPEHRRLRRESGHVLG